MLNYQKILVALDIHTEYKIVLERALAIAHSPTHLHLVYATLPHVYFEPLGAAYGDQIVTDLREKSKKRLSALAKEYGIPAEQAHAVLGKPVDEVHQLAEKLPADLIVIGTHGQSGIKLLLGSTANGVLHGVKCDVLAVKV